MFDSMKKSHIKSFSWCAADLDAHLPEHWLKTATLTNIHIATECCASTSGQITIWQLCLKNYLRKITTIRGHNKRTNKQCKPIHGVRAGCSALVQKLALVYLYHLRAEKRAPRHSRVLHCICHAALQFRIHNGIQFKRNCLLVQWDFHCFDCCCVEICLFIFADDEHSARPIEIGECSSFFVVPLTDEHDLSAYLCPFRSSELLAIARVCHLFAGK